MAPGFVLAQYRAFLDPSAYREIKALRALQKSMAEFGDLSGIVFNRRTGNLIGGHQRIKIIDPLRNLIPSRKLRNGSIAWKRNLTDPRNGQKEIKNESK